jgi:hypothetical protein
VSAKPACQLLQRSILPKCLADSRSRGPVKSCPHRCVLRESDSPLLAPACLESRNQPLPDLDVFLGRPAPMATAGVQMLTFGPRNVFQLRPARGENRAVCSGFLAKRMMGFEPTTFCMARKRRRVPAGDSTRQTRFPT